MLSKLLVRSSLALGVAACVLGTSHAAKADALLAPASVPDVSQLEVETAIAVIPNGSTRWSRLHYSGSRQVLWLVPVRPGGAIDWAPDEWLDALDTTTATRVVAPTENPPCGYPDVVERTESYFTLGSTQATSNVTIHAGEQSVRDRITNASYRLSNEMSAKISAIYASGSVLASIEVSGATANSNVTPTIRVSDDGGAIIPLALTGSARSGARVTAYVISGTATNIDGATQIFGNDLTWGQAGSGYAALRNQKLSSGAAQWLRESTSADVLFGGIRSDRVSLGQSTANAFLGSTCGATATTAAQSSGTLGRVCAPGALGVVPGGNACTPSTGTIDSASFTCNTAVDLALALSGTAPSNAWVSRYAGYISASTLGVDVPLITTNAAKSPVLTAGAYGACSAPPVYTPGSPQPTTTPDEPASHIEYITTSGGCGGSTTEVEVSDDDDTSSEEQQSSSSCGGSSASSSSDDTNTSDSSSCSGDSSSSSDDGWDKSDDDCSVVHLSKKKHHAKNGFSRYLMALALVILPLRRRLRRA